MQKVLLIILSLAMTLVFAAACSDTDTSAPAAPAPADTTDAVGTDSEPRSLDEGTPTTTVSIWFMGGSVTDDGAVTDAANARLRELGLAIDVNLIWQGGWEMNVPAQVALDTGDTGVDIFWTGSWGLEFWPNARLGNFVRLDNPDNDLLAQYGQNIRAEVPDFLWDAFSISGPSGRGIYGIPGYKDYAQLYTWDVNNTRLEELGFNFDDIFDAGGLNYDVVFDPKFEAAMQAAKDEYGDSFFPLAVEGWSIPRFASHTDYDMTGTGVFRFPFDPANPAQPSNPDITYVLEDDLTLRVLERMHHFWNQGFIDPRAAIEDEASSVQNEQRNAGEYLFSTLVYAYGHDVASSNQRGIDARFPRISMPIVSSVSAAGSGFAISVYSQNQPEAMQFMDAWYTDRELNTILNHGVEGLHFEFNADRTVTLDHDARGEFSPWRFGQGNVFILPPLEEQGPDYFGNFKAYNEQGIPTAFLGFAFDSTPVVNELAAMSGPLAQHWFALTIGALDPVTTVPQLLENLRASGSDRVLDELNRQLQEFYGR